MTKAREARELIPSDGPGTTHEGAQNSTVGERQAQESFPAATPIGTGLQLALLLSHLADCSDVLVLTLPRGVSVALEVAEALHAPLDIFIVRDLSAPGFEDLTIGAIATGKARVVFTDVVTDLGIPSEDIDAVTARELEKLQQRERDYRGNRPPPDIRGRIVVLIHDGVASGLTMRAAAAAIRTEDPKQIIVGLPSATTINCGEFRDEVDDIVVVGL